MHMHMHMHTAARSSSVGRAIRQATRMSASMKSSNVMCRSRVIAASEWFGHARMRLHVNISRACRRDAREGARTSQHGRHSTDITARTSQHGRHSTGVTARTSQHGRGRETQAWGVGQWGGCRAA